MSQPDMIDYYFMDDEAAGDQPSAEAGALATGWPQFDPGGRVEGEYGKKLLH
jgi:hypothetical protein